MKIIDRLKLPEVRNISDFNSPHTTILHSQIIERKKFLKRIYVDSYIEFKKTLNRLSSKLSLVELGSGGGFIKHIIPEIVTSDTIIVPNIDVCFSGQNMPFKDNAVDSFFMLNVFHHINNPRFLLRELIRVLKVGGKVFLIEPANTLWSRFIYRKFHHEDFDVSCGWYLNKKGSSPIANDALPWIIFVRDRKIFNIEFPELEITKLKIHTPFRYLISGGVSLKQLLPSFTYSFIKGFEYALSPFNKYIGMFMTIELKKC